MKNKNFLLSIIAIILAGIFIILVLVPRPEPEIVFVPTTPLPETQETPEETSPSTPAPTPTPPPIPSPTPTPTPNPTPTPSAKEFSLGVEFTAHQNEVFTEIDGQVKLEFVLTGFYYHPCPEGAMCMWSGLDVFYKLTACPANSTSPLSCSVYEKNQALQQVDSPYNVQIVDSDYQTYAKVIVTKK